MKTKNNKKSMMIFILVLIAMFILTRVILFNAYVPSESMENTLMTGDFLIGNRLEKNYRRGDIVIFKGESGDYLVKRLIGEPGDVIDIENNQVYVNGDKLDEPYLREPMYTDDARYIIPDDGYFFLGDNRNYSLDARYWKTHYILKKDIKAKVVLRYWPVTKATVFENPFEK